MLVFCVIIIVGGNRLLMCTECKCTNYYDERYWPSQNIIEDPRNNAWFIKIHHDIEPQAEQQVLELKKIKRKGELKWKGTHGPGEDPEIVQKREALKAEKIAWAEECGYD